MPHVKRYLDEAGEIISKVNKADIEKMITILKEAKKQRGRLFILGVGGGAGNASHAVNDFRKICGFEAYTPVDNVSELTARTNDEGWHTVFKEWLKTSRLDTRDTIFVFSVGGGDIGKNISANLVHALKYAKKIGAKILGIVGREGGYTAKVADACLIIPTVNADNITVHTESFQCLIWHLLVSDPRLKLCENKWEATISNKKRR